MVAELGHFALCLALGFALALTVLPSWGVFSNNNLLMAYSRRLAAGFVLFTLIAFVMLTLVFVADDFSVAIVAQNSNSLLPTPYKISAVWGNHEGSLLLWILMLSIWTFSVALFSRQLPLDMVARILAVLGGVSSGFLAFAILTSNPFARLLPAGPMEGQDLNPLLQDIGLIIHPPMLYLGYVGFSVAFAFAIAALWSGRLDTAWARWSRPWTNMAWAFLTLGIMLGSWWAYYELGWGGWWFWDPVENASFMPWLVGTALIHSLAVTEKRGVFKGWTVLLAIAAFSLSLMGMFLVRSGILTSVHSFAADPERGLFILLLLGIVIGGSLMLYAVRVPVVTSTANFSGWCRENLLLLNNILLVIAAATVLLGTLFPLIADALKLGKYSVGPPYFNAVFCPLMAMLVVFMAYGPLARWKRMDVGQLVNPLWPGLIAAVVAAFIAAWMTGGTAHWGVALGIGLAAWLLLSILVEFKQKIRHAPSLVIGVKNLRAGWWGMAIAHIGFAMTVAGVSITSGLSEERDIRLTPDQVAEISGYQFRLIGARHSEGPNYVADVVTLEITAPDKSVFQLAPEKRQYHAKRGQMMTEAAIDAGFWRDIYVAVGERLENDAWAVRLHYKPCVRWIWLGAILMALGGVLAIFDKRYRISSSSSLNQSALATGA